MTAAPGAVPVPEAIAVAQGARATSAGICADIPMCLHRLARLAGLPLSVHTAHPMKTPWTPQP